MGQGEAWNHVALNLQWQGMRELIEYDRRELQWGIGHPDSGHQGLAVQKGETPEELEAFLL